MNAGLQNRGLANKALIQTNSSHNFKLTTRGTAIRTLSGELRKDTSLLFT